MNFSIQNQAFFRIICFSTSKHHTLVNLGTNFQWYTIFIICLTILIVLRWPVCVNYSYNNLVSWFVTNRCSNYTRVIPVLVFLPADNNTSCLGRSTDVYISDVTNQIVVMRGRQPSSTDRRVGWHLIVGNSWM